MYAMLLNPPKKKKSRKRRKSSKRRSKLSKSCRMHIARSAARKRKRTLSARRAQRAARQKRKEERAFKGETSAARKDYWDVLPSRLKSSNPKRKRRRRRSRNYSHWIPAYAENPRRKRRRRRSRNYSHWIPAYAENPSWVPSYAMNPGVAGISRMATQAFSTKNLKKAGSVVIGAAANSTVNAFVNPYLPPVLQKGIGGVAFSLASAGLLSSAVGRLAPRLAGPVFFGGVFTAVKKLADEYILPALGLSGCCGIGDYASSMMTTPYMPDYSQTVGLNTVYPTDFALSPMSPYAYGMQGMGDYLTRADAAGASPLGGHSIDGVATAELSS